MFYISPIDYYFRKAIGIGIVTISLLFQEMKNIFTVILLTSYVVDIPFHYPVELFYLVAYGIIKLKYFELFTSIVLGCFTVVTSVVDFVVPYSAIDFTSAHIWESPVLHYHKITVIYPLPLLVVVTQLFS